MYIVFDDYDPSQLYNILYTVFVHIEICLYIIIVIYYNVLFNCIII